MEDMTTSLEILQKNREVDRLALKGNIDGRKGKRRNRRERTLEKN